MGYKEIKQGNNRETEIDICYSVGSLQWGWFVGLRAETGRGGSTGTTTKRSRHSGGGYVMLEYFMQETLPFILYQSTLPMVNKESYTE